MIIHLGKKITRGKSDEKPKWKWKKHDNPFGKKDYKRKEQWKTQVKMKEAESVQQVCKSLVARLLQSF